MPNVFVQNSDADETINDNDVTFFISSGGSTPKEIDFARLKELISGDEFSDAMERDITWTGINNNDAISTNLTPPSGTKMIYIAFRHEDVSSWEGGLFIDYAIWNAFTIVASGADMTDSNSWSYRSRASGSDAGVRFRVGKGTGGVLAVTSSGRGGGGPAPGDDARFDKICVRWVT